MSEAATISHAADFPGLKTPDGERWHYLDTAATAQKPQAVIAAMVGALGRDYATVHRGVYSRSAEMTLAYEAARLRVADFIGAESENEIVFVKGATEGINLVAQSWGEANIGAGDRIMLSQLEHHSNIVPWQIVAEQVGAVIKIVPVTSEVTLDLEVFAKLLSDKTKLIAFVEISNALGTINPVDKIIKMVRKHNEGIKILVDGSQGIVHQSVNVTKMDADFYVFTGHKLYAPTGVGVLYGKYDLLSAMPPYQGGGDMIERVSFKSGTTYREAPYRFEAGTPAIVEVIGFGAAVDYLVDISMDKIMEHERKLLEYATEAMNDIDGLTLHWTKDLSQTAGILSFTMSGAHPSDIGMILDQCGVAVRSGHHCAMPLMAAMGVDVTARASLALYSDKSDIDALIMGLKKVQELFG
ncbi:MAG: SufS family cysteine desulfurase [Robiginitomaculum sp.]|nr:SufS family cysteine desulfurase [Robiginitomaculum sp.]